MLWWVLDVWVEGVELLLGQKLFYETGAICMATTGELRAIIQELQLVDIGDAASYLGEEPMDMEEAFLASQPDTVSTTLTDEEISSLTSFCTCTLV
jgi:hypothetical protein